jgi:small GTP-binding protein
LKRLINKVPEFLTGLIVDIEGFIITEYSGKTNRDSQIELILKIIEPIIEKINGNPDKSLTSGTLDTDEFHLFYLELGGQNPALLVLVSEPSYDIEVCLPYIYLMAENISSILNGRPKSHILPEVRNNGSFQLRLPQSQNLSNTHKYEIYIIGEPGCGKTTLLNMFMNNKIDKNYKPTIGLSIYEKKYQISKFIQINFTFFEIGGLKTFTEVRKDYYNLASPNTILFMFDFDNYATSINLLKDFMEESFFYFGKIPKHMILVGNKIDKVNETKGLQEKISHIKNQYNCAYFETSAINGEGIDEIFTYLISNMDFKYELVT